MSGWRKVIVVCGLFAVGSLVAWFGHFTKDYGEFAAVCVLAFGGANAAEHWANRGKGP